jgi:hypothetical protein
MVEKTIWGIHMEALHKSRPVDEGFIAIGWDAVGDLSQLYLIIMINSSRDIKCCFQ